MLAIMATVIVINIIILSIFISHNRYSFNLLAEKQSNRLVSMIFDHTETYFNKFLNDASFFNELLSDQIIYGEYHLEDDLSLIEGYTNYITEKSIDRLSNISVVGYSDELGRFIGLRINPDRTTNLMLKDERTKDKLVIYSSDNSKSDVIASYDEYSPQSRPWYIPVKANPTTQWSEIYVNQDELMDLTMTVSTPVFNNDEFYGIVTTDVTLTKINDYLKESSGLDNGIIYILDKQNNILAHSSDENYINIDMGATPSYSLMSAINVSNPIISSSMQIIIDEGITSDSFTFSINNNNYYGYVDELDKASKIGLRAVVAIPEDDLLSNIEVQQYKSLGTVIIIVILGIVLKTWIIYYIIHPIGKVTNAARTLSNGDFSVDLKEESLIFYETYELVYAFNNMALELKYAFSTIMENESLLETKVLEKSEELQATYNELLESEKLASLGGLVAGISHEINTPLGVAVSACSYLQKQNETLYNNISQGKLSKDQFASYLETTSESIDIIDKNLTRATELINSFKQISVNQSSSIKSRFLLREYFETIFLTLKHEYKNLPFEYYIKCDLNLQVYGNPGDISQIFTNLIMNSLRHGIIEDNLFVISIDVEDRDDELIIYYKDNGRGISEDNLKHIFEPFFTTKRNQGGSGLGLNIVYNIVTANLDGTIICESKPDKGVLFLIKIPKSN